MSIYGTTTEKVSCCTWRSKCTLLTVWTSTSNWLCNQLLFTMKCDSVTMATSLCAILNVQALEPYLDLDKLLVEFSFSFHETLRK